MKLKIESYHEGHDFHLCRDENGDVHRLDLFVHGSLRGTGLDNENIVGREIEVDESYPYISIARNVTLLPPKDVQE